MISKKLKTARSGVGSGNNIPRLGVWGMKSPIVPQSRSDQKEKQSGSEASPDGGSSRSPIWFDSYAHNPPRGNPRFADFRAVFVFDGRCPALHRLNRPVHPALSTEPSHANLTRQITLRSLTAFFMDRFAIRDVGGFHPQTPLHFAPITVVFP